MNSIPKKNTGSTKKKESVTTRNIEADKNEHSSEDYNAPKNSFPEPIPSLKSTGISALFGGTADLEALGEDNTNLDTSPISVSKGNSIASLSSTHPNVSPASTFHYKAQRASVAESDFRTKVLSSLAELTKSSEANRLAIIQLKSTILMNKETVPASLNWPPTHSTPCKNLTGPGNLMEA